MLWWHIMLMTRADQGCNHHGVLSHSPSYVVKSCTITLWCEYKLTRIVVPYFYSRYAMRNALCAQCYRWGEPELYKECAMLSAGNETTRAAPRRTYVLIRIPYAVSELMPRRVPRFTGSFLLGIALAMRFSSKRDGIWKLCSCIGYVQPSNTAGSRTWHASGHEFRNRIRTSTYVRTARRSAHSLVPSG